MSDVLPTTARFQELVAEIETWPFADRENLVGQIGLMPGYCPGCNCTLGSPACHAMPTDPCYASNDECPAPCPAEVDEDETMRAHDGDYMDDEPDDAGSDPLPINVYTNAPAGYDYESTVISTVGVDAHTSFSDMNRASPFRLVALDAREGGYYADYQQQRYKSGGYLVLPPEQWDTWVDEGILILGARPEKGDDDAPRA